MKKIFSVFLFSIIFISKIFAQENLPYSRYGVGFLQPQQFQSTMGMGNLTAAFQSEWMANPANPASYAALAPKSTTFDVALQMRWSTIVDANSSTRFFDMNPSYLGISSLVHNSKKTKIGIGFNLMPYSKISYNIAQKGAATDTPIIDKTVFSGTGNLYKFQMGSGVSFKNLYLGIQGGYMFGKLFNSTQIYYPDSAHTLGTEYYRQQNPGGFCWQAGLQYVIKTGKESKLIVGANYEAAVSLQLSELDVWRRFSSYGGAYEYLIDTVRFTPDTVGKMKIPAKISFGLQWVQGRQWALGAQFEQQDWSQYRNFGQVDSLKKSWKLALGGFFSPDPLSTQVFRRAMYKFGFNYGLDPIYLRGKQFNFYSFSAGASLPITIKAEENRPMFMFVHLNFEAGSRGTTTNNLINENYFRINFGLTISGNWYQRRKFD